MKKFLFTTENEKLQQNFMNFQFEDPKIYAREAVSNALDSGATEVWVQVSPDIFSCEDDGVGMSKQDIDEFFLKIHSSKTQEREDKIGEHGIGVISFWQEDPRYVEVETVKNRVNYHFRIDNDLSLIPLQKDRRRKGTEITIYKKKSEEPKKDGFREEEIIRKYCKYHPTPIYVNGKEINKKPEIDSPLTGRIEGDGIEGVVGIKSRDKNLISRIFDWISGKAQPEGISLLNNWILLEELEDDYLKGIVNSNKLSPVLSRNKAKRDEAFDQLKEKIELAKLDLRREEYEKESYFSKRGKEAYEYFIESIKQNEISYPDFLSSEVGELEKKLSMSPIFSFNDYSLKDIGKEIETHGDVLYTQHVSSDLEDKYNRKVLEYLKSEELEILEEIFPEEALTNLTQIEKEKKLEEERKRKERKKESMIKGIEVVGSSLSLPYQFFSTLAGKGISLGREGSEEVLDSFRMIKDRSGLPQIGKLVGRGYKEGKVKLKSVKTPVNKIGSRYRKLREDISQIANQTSQRKENLKKEIRKSWGEYRTNTRLIEEENYSEKERDFLSYLSDKVEEIFGDGKVRIKHLKLAESEDISDLALDGKLFGKDGKLYLNRNNLKVKKAIENEDKVKESLIPLVAGEGIQSGYVHSSRSKAYRVDKSVDCVVDSLLEEYE